MNKKKEEEHNHQQHKIELIDDNSTQKVEIQNINNQDQQKKK